MNFKLALAAAAVVGLAGTAQAADLAKKAPAAADYVKVCDAYGAGFFYIPGSETCLKIGGYVRVELRTGNHSGDVAAPGINMGSARTEHSLNSRVRSQLTFDARTNTEMGLLRSYIELWATNDSGSTGTVSVNMRNAFVQFAGLTAGRATSNFDFIEGGYNIGNIEPDTSDRRANLLAYTFAFGNGITATLGIEDFTTGDQATPAWNDVGVGRLPGLGRIPAAVATAGVVKWPDIVGNLAVAQAWGRAQLMFAIHENNTAGALAVNTNRKTGYAIGGGIEVNLPMLGAGDKAFLQGIYANGATSYVFNNQVTNARLHNVGAAAPGTPIGYVRNWDGVSNSTAWSVSGGLNHNFSKAVEANLGASYAKYDDASGFATFIDRDFTQWVVGGDIRWKPVTGLTLAAALDYRSVNYREVAARDGSQWMATLRVQRNF